MTCGNLSCTDDISSPDWGQMPLKVKSKIYKIN